MSPFKALLALVLATLLAPLALAQADPQAVANETVQKGKSVVEGVIDTAPVQLPAVETPTEDGFAIGDAVSAVGRFLEAVAQTAAAAAAATGRALAVAGSAFALTAATLVTLGVQAASVALQSLGALMAAALAAAGAGVAGAVAWLGAAAGAVLALYAKFLASLRPAAMDPALFQAVAAAGTAGSAGAAGYGLWTLAKRYAWLLGGMAGMAGFTRIEDSALLEHPLRARVFQVIQENPGIHASELSRQVGAGWGTIVHHLDKLEKGRLVTARRVNNQKCFFEDGGKVSRQDMAIAGAVRGDSASLITAYVTAHPMTSQKAMAVEIGISPALASFHVKKLAGLGVLEKVRRGKETLLTTTQAVRRVLPMSMPTAAPVAIQA